MHGHADRGEVADPALELEVRPARVVARIGHAHLGDQLCRLESGRERPLEEVLERDRALAEGALHDDLGADREQRRAPVALWIRVRERPADGAEVAHDRVGDLRRRIAERPVTPAQEVGTLAVPVPYQSADSKPTVPHGEPVEAPAAIDVDHGPRRGEAELHERDQALASGEDAGLVAVALQDRERLVEIRRREVLEGGRVHGNASSRRARPTRRPGTSTPTSWLRQPYRRRVAATVAPSSRLPPRRAARQ